MAKSGENKCNSLQYTLSTTKIHKRHITQQSYIHNALMMITTTTIHTQWTNNSCKNNHTYIVHKQWLQSKSVGEKDEFSKHFWKWTVNFCLRWNGRSIVVLVEWSLISKGTLLTYLGFYIGNCKSATVCQWMQASWMECTHWQVLTCTSDLCQSVTHNR